MSLVAKVYDINPTFYIMQKRTLNSRLQNADALLKVTECATSSWHAQVQIAILLRLPQLLRFPSGLSIKTLSAHSALDLDLTERLLNAGVAIDILSKHRNKYRLSARIARLLRASKAAGGLVAWLDHWHDVALSPAWRLLCSRLPQSVRKQAHDSKAHAKTGEPDYINWLNHMQRGRNEHTGPTRVATTLPGSNWYNGMDFVGRVAHASHIAALAGSFKPRTVIDIGSGSGAYAKAILKGSPQAHVTILDFPAIHPLAIKVGLTRQWQHRCELIVHDARKLRLARAYEMAILGNVLHMFDGKTAADILKRVALYLAPGGRVIIQQWPLSDDGTSPSISALFNVHLGISFGGKVHKTAHVCDWLHAAGLISEGHQRLGLYEVIWARKR